MKKTSEEISAPTNYYRQLDALRFFAVLSVMIGHWISWDTKKFLLNALHWGNGVIFFFVLSGFLITEILLNQKAGIDSEQRTFWGSIKNFYVRRSLRIFPIYYLLILFLFYVNYKNTRELFPYLASYTINIHEAGTNEFVGDFNHFWSLAVEEQFYISWPVLIFLIPARHLLKFIVATFVLSIGSRICYGIFYPDRWIAAMYLTHNVMFALSAGAFLAYIKKNKPLFFSKISNSVIATPLMAVVYLCSFFLIAYKKLFPAFTFLFDEALFSLLAFVIIARAVGNGYKGFGKWLLESRFFKHLGQISYGLYLYHLFVIPVFYANIPFALKPSRKKVAWLVFFLITWAAAEISYFGIEKPVSRLKKYFRY